jgi:hypothetical protein
MPSQSAPDALFKQAFPGQIPDDDDDTRHIAETRQYLRDFNGLDQATDTPRELFDAMIALYPDRANPGSLWRGANAAKAAAATAS